MMIARNRKESPCHVAPMCDSDRERYIQLALLDLDNLESAQVSPSLIIPSPSSTAYFQPHEILQMRPCTVSPNPAKLLLDSTTVNYGAPPSGTILPTQHLEPSG